MAWSRGRDAWLLDVLLDGEKRHGRRAENVEVRSGFVETKWEQDGRRTSKQRENKRTLVSGK